MNHPVIFQYKNANFLFLANKIISKNVSLTFPLGYDNNIVL